MKNFEVIISFFVRNYRMSKTNVYVLRLEGGKYYVGKSEDVQKRFQQHLKGGGSAWTRKHSPISVLKTYTNVSHFEEDKVTKELMAKYGIDKVRGGSYSEVVLDRAQLESLEREIRGAKDLCNRCGKSGHFANRCDEEDDEDDEEDVEDEDVDEWLCDYCDRGFTTRYGCMVHERSCKETGKSKQGTTSGACYRCGRPGHYSPDCYASRHVKGYELN